MNYELALALKNAGFPQKWIASDAFTKEDAERAAVRLQNGLPVLIPAQDPYIPTLGELIEACGDYLLIQSPSYQENPDNTEFWRVIGRKEKRRCTSFGSTPTEAVARLWLALHSPTTTRGE